MNPRIPENRGGARSGAPPANKAARTFLAFLAALAWTALAGAAEPGTESEKPPLTFTMDEVVVTASRTEEKVRDVPKNVTVITRQEIEDSGADSLTSLLSREAGLAIRSPLGNDRQAVVDIRGLGDTAVSGVVLMVDGVRQNFADLRGADLSIIPLDRVESVEIVRGAGGVLYGNGAVGGVVNIRTRRPTGPPRASASASWGSFDTLDTRASSDGRVRGLAFDLGAGYLDSDGYRENGYLRKKDASAKVSRFLGDRVAVDLSGSWYEARQGLPGAVPAEWADDEDLRRETRNPLDFSGTRDMEASGGVSGDLGDLGKLSAKRSWRFRDDSFLLGFSPLVPRPDQTDDIEENSRFLNLGYQLPFELYSGDHELVLGLDRAETDYIRQENSRARRANSRLDTLGGFGTLEAGVTDTLTVKGGFRQEVEDVRFPDDAPLSFGGPRFWVNGDERETDFDNQAWDAGLVWRPAPFADLFLDASQSFRTPNVDELAFAAGNLAAQEGHHLDAGARARLGRRVELSLSLFRILITDEIFFDQAMQRNRNFEDDTLRQGLEAGVRAAPADFLFLWANSTWMTAEFSGTNTTVPLVPGIQASGGAEVTFLTRFLLSVSGQWTGERYDGNDFTNDRYEKLDAYYTADARLRYRRARWEAWAGVENVFNEFYSTLAYSEAHYPMPGRSFAVGVKGFFP